MAGTAVKASGTDAQPDAAGSVLWGLGNFPNKPENRFRVTKALLAEEQHLREVTIIDLLSKASVL